MLILERPPMAYIYIYICFEWIQFSSLFSGNLFHYLSQVMPWIDFPTGTLFSKVYPRICWRILWRKS
jgi:hypothetical protein